MSDIFKDLKFSDDNVGVEAEKVEHALFFCNNENDRCFLLHEVGAVIESDIEAGLDRDSEAGPWSDLPKEPGLWIWEGIPGWNRFTSYEYGDEGGEPIYDGRGKSRRPTPEELQLIVEGKMKELWGEHQLHKSKEKT